MAWGARTMGATCCKHCPKHSGGHPPAFLYWEHISDPPGAEGLPDALPAQTPPIAYDGLIAPRHPLGC